MGVLVVGKRHPWINFSGFRKNGAGSGACQYFRSLRMTPREASVSGAPWGKFQVGWGFRGAWLHGANPAVLFRTDSNCSAYEMLAFELTDMGGKTSERHDVAYFTWIQFLSDAFFWHNVCVFCIHISLFVSRACSSRRSLQDLGLGTKYLCWMRPGSYTSQFSWRHSTYVVPTQSNRYTIDD